MMPLPTPNPPPTVSVRKELIVGGNTKITLDTIHLPQGGGVVALSFYTLRGEWPGFNMCFPLGNWKDFQRAVADYEPES
jgi:hypothetical protein